MGCMTWRAVCFRKDSFRMLGIEGCLLGSLISVSARRSVKSLEEASGSGVGSSGGGYLYCRRCG